MLTAAISAAGGPNYSITDIVPVDDRDGGAPGGNIRVAYLYKPELIRLYKPNPGGSLDANEVLAGPTLKYNPGRIEPSNPAWTASRKPLVAQWEVIGKAGAKKNNIFFTVNVHFGSKGGSSSLHGDARPPVNGGVGKFIKSNKTCATVANIVLLDDRLEQARLTANFVKVRSLVLSFAAVCGKAVRRRVAVACFSYLSSLGSTIERHRRTNGMLFP
jgi:hypothetical protein